eukprot:m.19481 g.19481  ORF g.19481 m.19481 type:complete len:568 (-) comp8040_c0_seq2:104-1807(-)
MPPLPPMYQLGGDILTKAQSHQGTVKSMCLNAHFHRKKKLYAVVCQTLKFLPVIDQLISSAKLNPSEAEVTENILRMLVYDAAIGNGLKAKCDAADYVNRHLDALTEALADAMRAKKVDSVDGLLSDASKLAEKMPKYVRVNLIKTTVEDAVGQFESEGFIKTTVTTQKDASQLKQYHFAVDPHVSDLLVFAPKTDLHEHPLYKSGEIIFQDKASCMPASILSPPPNATCMDACSAPGNKTSHLAASMRNTGAIFAFDIDRNRLKLMDRMLDRAGASCVSSRLQSFLDADPQDDAYSQVEYIVCDPSCSGSGIVSRLNSLVDGGKRQDSAHRLASLASFQTRIVTHAMAFPNLKAVTYSTCSIHQEENEQVVKAILKLNPHFQLANALPSWPTRGQSLGDRNDYSLCVRTDPAKDFTNGFFVALFERKEGVKAPKYDKAAVQQKTALPQKPQSGPKAYGQATGKGKSHSSSSAAAKTTKGPSAPSSASSFSGKRQHTAKATTFEAHGTTAKKSKDSGSGSESGTHQRHQKQQVQQPLAAQSKPRPPQIRKKRPSKHAKRGHRRPVTN